MLSQAYERRCALLARLCRGEAVPDADLQCAFQENPAVRAALLRINGLPRRFMGMGAPTPASWTREPLCAYSRDDRAWLCVYEEDGPLMTLERAAADAQAAGNYTTLLLYDRPFPIGALRESILGLYDGLTAYCVVGLSQRLALDDARLPIPPSMMDLNALYLSLEQYRKTGDYGLLKRSIMQRIHRSHQHPIPLRLLEEAGKTPVYFTGGETWATQVLFLGDYYNIQAEYPTFAEEYTEGKAKYADIPVATRSWTKGNAD